MKIKPCENFLHAYAYACAFPGLDTMSHHWRAAGASDQHERGNAADTHAVSLIERELPSATYLERFHPSVSVCGSNCLQNFASAIVREELGDIPGSGTPLTGFW